ncbi:DUF397 domain-containing protein [Actinomadura alba]|uniref:DUF397 domain-containing protein n=1 Tax=Actinomadura alba TaxID=406431 RepID=A0ABR7LTS5_9ACTN|nr:DUF397 domain-containing protein [Actinomadura alba]MBC6468248.1 DUF397 domain-containing protein [Actinomadura alba]
MRRPHPSDLVGLTWRKSSRSGSNSNCVEIGSLSTAVAVRDSKDPDGPCLIVDRPDWLAFIDAVKHREFDLSW